MYTQCGTYLPLVVSNTPVRWVMLFIVRASAVQFVLLLASVSRAARRRPPCHPAIVTVTGSTARYSTSETLAERSTEMLLQEGHQLRLNCTAFVSKSRRAFGLLLPQLLRGAFFPCHSAHLIISVPSAASPAGRLPAMKAKAYLIERGLR